MTDQSSTPKLPIRTVFGRRFEQMANIAILAVAGVVAVTNIYERMAPKHVRIDSPPTPSNFVGRQLSLPSKYQGGAEAIMVLFLSSNCHYCSESSPFYRRLAAVRAESRGQLEMIAFFPEAEGSSSGPEYLARNGINLDIASPVSFKKVGVRGTPTLMLLDSGRRVKFVWTGLLNSDKETQVISSLKELCGACVRS